MTDSSLAVELRPSGAAHACRTGFVHSPMTDDRACQRRAEAPARRPALPLLDRERSILQFNRRVLAQARRADVPLLERLRYITIVSSNLDEFFEVRVADIIEATRQPGSGVTRQRPGLGGQRRARTDRRTVRAASTTC